MAAKSKDFEVRWPGLKSYLELQVLWTWEHYLNFLSLSVFTYTMGMITIVSGS